MRLGVFGGTFDPIHIAHLIIAECMRQELQLDRVLVVPALNPPHKDLTTLSDIRMRFEMVRLAVADNPFLLASDIEIQKSGISYTVDTLLLLGRNYQLDREHLFLLIGADSLADIHRWYRPDRIFEIATVAIAQRPGIDWVPGQSKFEEKITYVSTPLLDISATRIRNLVKQGKTIRYLVPTAVESFIYQNNLYK